MDSIAAALTHPRPRTSHNLTNLLIDLDGDVATAESYCVTFARIKADGQYYHSFTGARMIDRLERRDGSWGIAHRRLGTGTTTPPKKSTGCGACSPPTRAGAAHERQFPGRFCLGRPPLIRALAPSPFGIMIG